MSVEVFGDEGSAGAQCRYCCADERDKEDFPEDYICPQCRDDGDPESIIEGDER